MINFMITQNQIVNIFTRNMGLPLTVSKFCTNISALNTFFCAHVSLKYLRNYMDGLDFKI